MYLVQISDLKGKRVLVKLILIILIIYISICVLLFIIQERLLFFPDKMNKDAAFKFDQKFEDLYITTKDGVRLNGVLFKSNKPEGIIFYLHGNGGSVESWGEIATKYTSQHFDCFILDYRGYGKSEGKITSERQLHEDVQFVFDEIKARHQYNKIIVLGYSLGTALAAKLASVNDVDMLILQAPYFSMTDVMNDHYHIIPPFILRYKLETFRYVKNCRMPVVIFHGTGDKLINYQSSVRLKELLKPSDTLILLKGQGHNEMTYNREYIDALNKILETLH
jgi:alpha-beta hydrolase superfamily lysophospholipase